MTTALRDKFYSDDEPVKLSICSISFNHRSFIKECLDGFLDQVCDFRVEIVIYDDASTDGTADIIREYAERHPTIFRTFLHPENLYSKGVNPYFGFVMPAARGDFIAICDGDDYWDDPNKLARQVAVLEADPDTVLTYGRVRAITDDGVVADYVGGAERDLSSAELKAGPPINTLTACLRNIYQDAPTSLFIRTSTIGDLTVWAMLGYHGKGRFLSDLPPANYRKHADGLISTQNRERQLFMTALTHGHLAAYHSEQNDDAARQVSLGKMREHFNHLGFEHLIDAKPGATPPKALFKLWRRAIKHRLLGKSR